MNKQALIVGIALSLVTSACTGLGVQTGPTLTSQIREEQGLNELWGERGQPSPNSTVSVEVRDEDTDDLWMEARENVEFNGHSGEPAPRAEALLDRLILTDSEFGVYSNTSEILFK